ncbi:positive regulation of dendritic spine morphogenesis [Mactra antiquata]
MRHLFIFPLILCCSGVKATGSDAVLQRLEELSQRVDHLESREKLHLQKINDLESRDQLQQATIDKLEREVQEQRQLIESMDEIQQATIIELEAQRQLMESMGETLESNGINKTSSASKTPNPDHNAKMSRSMSSIKERSAMGIRQAEFESPVAFYAHLGNHHFEHAGVNQIIIYDSIVTNVGNGYNDSLGAFTAPVDGIYVFSSTMVALQHRNAHSSFFKNSDRINTMFASGVESQYDTSSSTIVLQLSKGDVITVRNGDADTSIHGYDHSSFSGFLLTGLNNNQNVIIGK